MPTVLKKRISLSQLVLVVAVLSLGAGLKWISGTPLDNREFSRSEWMDGPRQNRAFMAYDLIENHLQAGMSRDEVLKLLGNPSIGSGSNYSNDSSQSFKYWIASSWLRTPGDDTYIYIHFDKDGSLIESEVYGR